MAPHFSAVTMELKTKTDSGLAITSGGRTHITSGKTNGGLELKMPIKHTVPFTVKVLKKFSNHSCSLVPFLISL